MATADVLLHPVRMRILQALFDADPLTTAQLRERLPDIAPATMYRQIAVLAEAGIDPRSFAVGGGEMEGTRRPYRVPVEDLRVAPEGPDGLILEFALPRGSYAACVLREVMKEGPPDEED